MKGKSPWPDVPAAGAELVKANAQCVPGKTSNIVQSSETVISMKVVYILVAVAFLAGCGGFTYKPPQIDKTVTEQ